MTNEQLANYIFEALSKKGYVKTNLAYNTILQVLDTKCEDGYQKDHREYDSLDNDSLASIVGYEGDYC